MGPVNGSAFRVPFILAEKRDFIANFKRVNSGCEVNIVSDQERLARFEFNDKSLMPTPIVIVTKDPSDHSSSFDLKIALMLNECASQPLVSVVNCGLSPDRGSVLLVDVPRILRDSGWDTEEQHAASDHDKLFHSVLRLRELNSMVMR